MSPKRILFLAYGLVSYLLFLAVFLNLASFVAGVGPLFSVDGGREASLPAALAINLGLIALFGIQHAIMARPGFKAKWTRLVPEPIERSTFVLIGSACLLLLMSQWRALPQVLWHVDTPALQVALWAAAGTGWLIVLLSTYLIDHFELFGVRQVWESFRGKARTAPSFKTPLLYKLVRHPLMTGFLIGFWVTPHMTLGHLVFAGGMTTYVLLGTRLEERDLIAAFGDAYREYKAKVPGLIPGLRPAS